MYIILVMNTQKEKKKITLSKVLRRAGLSLLASVLLPLMLLISVPFEIYAANYEEYIFALSEFFSVCVGFFFLFTFVIFVAIFFLPKKAFRIVSAILIALALLCFVQGNYLNGNLEHIGGDNMAEKIPTGLAVASVVVWAVVLVSAIVVACLKDKKSIASYVGVVLALILLVTQIVAPITVAVSKKEIFASESEKRGGIDGDEQTYFLSDKNIHTASKEGNVYWFVVDRFDESFAEQAYVYNRSLIEGLEGFTWFQNHLARYNHTFPAVAEMLTDNDYDPYMTRWRWLRKVYENPHPLDTLNANGYTVNLYTESFYSYDKLPYLPDYVANVTLSSTYQVRDRVGLAMSVVGVGLYRDLPFYLKDVIDIDSSTSNDFVEEADAEGNERYSTGISPKVDFSTSGGKGFYFIHTDGCHDSREPMYGGLQAVDNLKEINRYLDYLKKEGLYENATIIITGDHGIVDEQGFDKPNLTALFVKPSGVGSGKLKISYAPTCHKNLWATIFKSENITTDKDYGPSVFDIAEDAVVERYITSHGWSEFSAYTYKVVGDARNFDNWELIDELVLDKSLIS